MNFENLHKNQKWAFIDGFLTALVIVSPMLITCALEKRSKKTTTFDSAANEAMAVANDNQE